ncbi:MAG TPA: ABC transporter substrate-binding protein [Thermomicrobiaceae bacterium]|nr:ABC transporter substrate-binding protein [Thermomicrobiaceae bacterium]
MQRPRLSEHSGDPTASPGVSRRSFLRLIAGSVAAAAAPALLAACGGSTAGQTPASGGASTASTGGSAQSTQAPAATATQSTQATSAAATASTPAASASPAAATVPGQGTAITASSVDFANLDPAVGHDGATSNLQKHVYDSLYRHIGNPVQLVPWLATGNEVSQDAKQWTFHLDSRAKFQDGTPVTANDVVYSTQRLLSINQGTAYMFKGVLSSSGVQAVDDHTVKFTLDNPYAPFLHATTWIFILNSAMVKKNEQSGDQGKKWLTTNAAGSGPFVIKNWQQGTIYQFDADPNYWRGWPTPHVSSWVYQLIRESATERLSLQQDKIQMANWLSVNDMKLLQQTQGVVVPSFPSLSVYSIKLNNQRGPTSDVHVRRAIAYAMDYKALLDYMQGRAVSATGPLPPPIQFSKDLTYYDTDLTKAKAELALSAQYKDGFSIDFTYVTGLDEERTTGLILLNQLAKLNIKVNIVAVEWVNAVATFSDPNKSPLMFPIYSASDFPDPDAFLWSSFYSGSAGTWSGASWYKNPQVDQLLVQARSTTDQTQRNTLYEQAQKTILDDAVEVFAMVQAGGLPYRNSLSGSLYSPVMGSSPWWYDIAMKA